jgi:phosphate transport system permease protein
MSNHTVNEVVPSAAGLVGPGQASAAVSSSLRRRYAAETRFKVYGIIAISIAVFALVVLFTDIVRKAIPAFTQTMVTLEVSLFPQDIDPERTGDPDVIGRADYRPIIRQALYDLFPEVESRADQRQLMALISPGAVFEIRQQVLDAEEDGESLIGQRVKMLIHASDDLDRLNKGLVDEESAEASRRVSDKQIEWFQRLKDRGLVETTWNYTLFERGDSRSPPLAGIRGALIGTMWTMLFTLVFSFVLAIAAAIYLEEFAPKNRWTDLIEVNINNLAAVPSIVFGLLGLAMFINLLGMPRSAPITAACVLTLMTLPTIIIAARAALKAVPPSIREAALGVGASKVQAVFQHVLPLAMPGMLTGTIIGMAQAMGETAPLLMIGMIAFIVDIPAGPLDPATVLPVQIYLWSDLPEKAYEARASAAILVLLGFLVLFNALAVLLRKRFERKW